GGSDYRSYGQLSMGDRICAHHRARFVCGAASVEGSGSGGGKLIDKPSQHPHPRVTALAEKDKGRATRPLPQKSGRGAFRKRWDGTSFPSVDRDCRFSRESDPSPSGRGWLAKRDG